MARTCGALNVLHVSLFQNLLNLSPNQRKNFIQAKETGTMERLAPATLKEFSLEYFRYNVLHLTTFFLNQQENAHWRSTDSEDLHLVPLILQAAHEGCEPSGDLQERCS